MSDVIEVTFKIRREGESTVVYTRPFAVHPSAWPDQGDTTASKFFDAIHAMAGRFLRTSLDDYDTITDHG